jgi:hypothetical protein
MDVLSDSNLQGYAVKGLLRSPVPGPKGNIEFLAWLDNGQDEGLQDPKLEDMVVQVVTGP